MRDAASLLPSAGIHHRNEAPPDGYNNREPIPCLNMGDPNLPPENENQGALEGLMQPPIPLTPQPPVDDGNDGDDEASSPEAVSPRTVRPGPATNPAPVPVLVFPHNTEQEVQPNRWADTVAPEERAIMENSANVARNRRLARRNAVQLDAAPEMPAARPASPSPSDPPSLVSSSSASSSSLASPSRSPSPPLPRIRREDDDDNDDTPAPPTNTAHRADLSSMPLPATPRARLQRSFGPSERDNAGPVMAPGLLRRLGRPFSGPWQGPSSPLASLSSISLASVGCLPLPSLRRLFSRRRR